MLKIENNCYLVALKSVKNFDINNRYRVKCYSILVVTNLIIHLYIKHNLSMNPIKNFFTMKVKKKTQIYQHTIRKIIKWLNENFVHSQHNFDNSK